MGLFGGPSKAPAGRILDSTFQVDCGKGASQPFKQTPSQPSLPFDNFPTPHIIWIKKKKKKEKSA